MKVFDRLRASVGIGPERSLPAPKPVAIADGLLVLDDKAEAWFTITTANTDLDDEEDLDAALDQILATADKVLKNRLCHLKVVWSQITGDTYVQEAHEFATGTGGIEWAETRADRIDELGLPQRHVLLAVHLTDRASDSAQVRGRALDAIGAGSRRIRKKELARLDAHMRKLARSLGASEWQALPASAEMIAWAVQRENHRALTPIPREGTIAGATVRSLTSGRILPFSDHLRMYDARNRMTSCTTVLALTEFPEEMDSPGEGEWLRSLSEIRRIADVVRVGEDGYEEETSEEVAVIAEASVRFRVMSRGESLKAVDKARKSAKEQRRSASEGSAETTFEEIEETEALMSGLRKSIMRDRLNLVETYPLILVTEANPSDLEASVDAVIEHFSSRGITAAILADEQREGWLQSLPGDVVRITDLGHTQTATALFGSWWWGGSQVGDDEGPVVGAMTGSTPGLVRFDAAGGSRRGDSTTTAFLGKSGRGKSTALMLCALDVVASGGWAGLLDFKGDLSGVVDVAQLYGMPSELIKAGADYSGAADLFRLLPDPEEAVLHVVNLLRLLAPKDLKPRSESVLLAATQKVARTGDPTTWAVIQDLVASTDQYTRELGSALQGLATTPLGSTVAGPPVGDGKLRNTPGMWVMQLPGLNLPRTGRAAANPDEWDPMQRVSMACLRGFTAWAIHMAGNSGRRGMRKFVGIPEAHLMTAVGDGADFLEFIARVGRALGVSLAIDTQDGGGIKHLDGLVEQLSAVFQFEQFSRGQQDTACELVGLTVNDANRELVRTINKGPKGAILHGHCIMRDWKGNVGTMQWDYPSAAVADLMSTTPDEDGPDDWNDDDIAPADDYEEAYA